MINHYNGPGKGSKPRNLGKKFQDNYNEINWNNKKTKKGKKK